MKIVRLIGAEHHMTAFGFIQIKFTNNFKDMVSNKLTNIGLIIIFSIGLFSCNNYSKKDARKYLPGKYLYTFPSGETSILIIKPDFTFNNKIYTKNKKDILYENNGTMEVDGRNITFENFLLFTEHTESEMIFSKPDIGIDPTNYWRKPKENKGVVIILFGPYNYIYTKIE